MNIGNYNSNVLKYIWCFLFSILSILSLNELFSDNLFFNISLIIVVFLLCFFNNEKLQGIILISIVLYPPIRLAGYDISMVVFIFPIIVWAIGKNYDRVLSTELSRLLLLVNVIVLIYCGLAIFYDAEIGFMTSNIIKLLFIISLVLYFDLYKVSIGYMLPYVILSAVSLSIMIFFQYFELALEGFIDTPMYSEKTYYGAYQGALVGAFLAISILFLSMSKFNYSRIGILVFSLTIIISLSAMIVSGKRTWLLSLAFCFAVYFCTGKYKFSKIAIVSMIGLFFVAFYMDSLVSSFYFDMNIGRLLKWKYTIESIVDNTFFGRGFLNLDISGYGLDLRGQGEGARNSDNLLLNYISYFGVIGAFLIITFFSRVFFLYINIKNYFTLFFFFFIMLSSIFWDLYGSGTLAMVIVMFLLFDYRCKFYEK